MVGLYYGIYQHITDVDHPDRYFRSQWGGRPQSLGVKPMGGATGGCGGTVSPNFWDQRGTGGTRGGPMKMIFAATADSLYSVLYMTEFQLPWL